MAYGLYDLIMKVLTWGECIRIMKPFIINPRFFLLSLCSAYMIGLGFRLLIDGFFNHNIFSVNLFDAVFDWGILIILGILLFIYTIHQTIKANEESV